MSRVPNVIGRAVWRPPPPNAGVRATRPFSGVVGRALGRRTFGRNHAQADAAAGSGAVCGRLPASPPRRPSVSTAMVAVRRVASGRSVVAAIKRAAWSRARPSSAGVSALTRLVAGSRSRSITRLTSVPRTLHSPASSSLCSKKTKTSPRSTESRYHPSDFWVWLE